MVDIIVSHDGSLSSFDINRKVVVGEVDVSKEKTLSFSIRKSDTLIISVVPAAEGMVAYTTINEKKKLFTDNSLTIVVTEDIIIEIATEDKEPLTINPTTLGTSGNAYSTTEKETKISGVTVKYINVSSNTAYNTTNTAADKIYPLQMKVKVGKIIVCGKYSKAVITIMSTAANAASLDKDADFKINGTEITASSITATQEDSGKVKTVNKVSYKVYYYTFEVTLTQASEVTIEAINSAKYVKSIVLMP